MWIYMGNLFNAKSLKLFQGLYWAEAGSWDGKNKQLWSASLGTSKGGEEPKVDRELVGNNKSGKVE